MNRSAQERCDSGALNSDAWQPYLHCAGDCRSQARACGDGVIDPEESCDTGGQSGGCEETCQAPVCGDGVVNTAAGEACDTAGPDASCQASCQPRKRLTLGKDHTCLVRDQRAFCFGANKEGELGALNPAFVGDPLETMGENVRPLPLPDDAPVDSVDAGDRLTCVRTVDGRIACFGRTNDGQTGSGTPYIDLGSGQTALDLAVGANFACALRAGGDVVCWGGNTFCQLGRGNTDSPIGDDPSEMGAALVPVNIGGQAISIIAGDFFACALRTDGALVCWGQNDRGQLGQGDTLGRGCSAGILPPVPLVAPVTHASLGDRHACVLLSNGRVQCWGYNGFGQLGLGDRRLRGA